MVHAPHGSAVRTVALVVLLTAASFAGVDAHTVTVRRGETLSGIAARQHTSLSVLVRLNHLADPDLIHIGQRLRIPGDASALSPRLIAATVPTATGGYHVVRPGETVASVAAAFGVSRSALAAANGVTNNMLYAGARIRVDVSRAGAVPSPAFPFVAQPVHTVSRGETLGGVARRMHVGVAALAHQNGLSPRAPLVVGERLVVPGRWMCPVAGPVHYMNDWGFSRLGGNWHQGIDLMAPRGTPVVAPVAGRLVRYPNHLGGNAFELYGNDGIRYYGAHLDRYGAEGHVRAGAVIGYVGDTGDAKGGAVHLHFEIHPDGDTAVPPYPTIALACR